MASSIEKRCGADGAGLRIDWTETRAEVEQGCRRLEEREDWARSLTAEAAGFGAKGCGAGCRRERRARGGRLGMASMVVRLWAVDWV
ncbi:hypothetical protein M0R45_036026 [Rubus argutus]|uniref:MHC class I antigen n=1 Tax=Rubus argutus TaxID=59490 RepID=A0AAW1VXP1_RUBAR